MRPFGERLREILAQRNLTQAEAANLLATSQSVISYYCGQEKPPRRQILGLMAERFGVSVGELLGETPLGKAKTRALTETVEPPQVIAMEHLKQRWKRKPKDREEIRHLIAILFPADADGLLAWLDAR
jgi:transcriptional regulator with XRE-family HTH domain